MKKKLCFAGIVMSVFIVLVMMPVTSSGAELPFVDVPGDAWYFHDVQEAYETGLVDGFEDQTFRPEREITCAQVVKLAACMNQKYMDGTVTLDNGSPHWYDSYVAYARDRDIIHMEYNWDAPATRAVCAEIFASALPEEAFSLKNYVEDDAIPDVPVGSDQAAAIYSLYRAGILTGNDPEGTFAPDRPVRRSEVSAILTRMMDDSVRKEVTLTFSREPQYPEINTADIRNGVRIPVLMYHEVSDEIWGLDYLFVSPARMRQQLQWLQDNGYQTIFFSDLTHLSDFRKPVMLTFDDGYEGNYTNLFPLLKEFNMKATIFVVSDEIGTEYRLTPYQIREMSDSGLVSVQSHTKSHARMNTLSEEQLTEECRDSQAVIGSITGLSPYVLSYPEGRYSTLSVSVVSRFYVFGVLDRNGSWKSNRHTLYRITRTVIPRSFTLKQFAAAVRR